MKKAHLSYVSLVVLMVLCACAGIYLISKSHAATATPPLATGTFVHPGIVVSQPQLDFVKAQIASGAQPWTAALAKAKASKYAAAAYTPSAIANVNCGPSNNPDIGCTDEDNDSHAAYTQALLWYYTGQPAYAQTAIRILNAWSATLKQHTGSNAPLVAAWEGEMFTRAAEIIRYSGAGWATTDINQFSTLLTNVYLPEYDSATAITAYASSNGNWDLSMADAKVAMGIFLDDHTVFDQGVAEWRARVPAYIYQTSDGALPVTPPGTYYRTSIKLVCHWLNRDSSCPATQLSTTFHNGQSQETCRDTVHVALGFASMVDAAESARNQGVDLYAEQAARIVSGFEYDSHVVNTVHSATTYPAGFCTNSATLLAPNIEPMYEMAYNEYAGRLGMSMPETLQMITKLRGGGGTGVDHEMAWETLTSAGTSGVSDAATPTPAPKSADMTGDNRVDVFDLSYLLGKWGTDDVKADLNDSGSVDIFDLSSLLGRWTG